MTVTEHSILQLAAPTLCRTTACLDGGASDALYERHSGLVVVLAGAVDVHQTRVVYGQAGCGVSLQASDDAALGPDDAPQVVLAHLERATDGWDGFEASTAAVSSVWAEDARSPADRDS